MTEQEIKRMIELLIREVDEAGEAEGIWFNITDAFELQKLLIKYQPDNVERTNLLHKFIEIHPELSR